jgi:hypothetical protein
VQGAITQPTPLNPEQLQQLQQLQMQQAQMQQQAPLQQAQVQQWQAQQGVGAPAAPTPTPEQRHAMQNTESYAQQRFMQATHPPLTPEQQKARQEPANIINNATLGTLGAATLGVGTALHETLGPSSSDLSKPHVSNVGNTQYDVMLEPVHNGPVGQTKRWFGGGASDPDLRVKHLARDGQPGVSIKYNGQGQPSGLAVELEGGAKAVYKLKDGSQWELSRLEGPKGRLKLGAVKLADLADTRTLTRLEDELNTANNSRNFFSRFNPKNEVARLTNEIKNHNYLLEELQKYGLGQNQLENFLNSNPATKFPLDRLEEVIKNAQIPHNWAEVFQKVATKGGLFAVLGALALGGGTWAFQSFTKKSDAQKRLEAEIANNQARLAQPGQPPPQPAQAMNPAMYGQNGMPPGMPSMYPQW